MINKKIFSLVYVSGVLFTLFSFPVFFSSAWSAPTLLPPATGSIEAPLNTGSEAQIKVGSITVDVFAAFMDSYFAEKLGIGTESIFATLDINPTITASTDLKNVKSGLVYNGGSAMSNYYGAYIAAPTGSGSITNKYALVTEPSAGKVGFGTVSPTALLSVGGGVQMGSDSSACSSTNAGTLRLLASTVEVCTGVAWTDISYANPCQPIAGCLFTASGGTCTTYSAASVAFGLTCPAGVVSTCSNGVWSPTAQPYNSCSVADEPVFGCTQMGACNYNAGANTNDGTCYSPGDPCQSSSNNCGEWEDGVIDNSCSCDANTPNDRERC